MNNIDDFFPNGFENWYETFYEVVDSITVALLGVTEYDENKVIKIQCTKDRGGLYELAKELTDGFEALYKGREWDGDYFDAVSEYLEKELYEQF